MNTLAGLDIRSLTPILLNIIGAILLIILTILAARWAERAIRRSLQQSKLDPTLEGFFSNLARYAVLVLGGLAVLGIFNISVASFAAILAAAGFAIGLALQGTLSHFAAGVMLLIFRPFSVGDRVDAGGVTGKIVEIGFFTTLFDTPDNRRLIVPNGKIFGSTIENVTYHDIRRIDISVGTAYEANLDVTRSVLNEAAENVEGGLSEPAPQVYLSELGASSINWSVRVWANTSDFGLVRERLTAQIKQSLDSRGVSIPYPQMNVHLQGSGREDNPAA